MSPYKMSKIEESIRITLKFLDCINNKNDRSLGELLSTECILKDIWENQPDCIARENIIEYFIKLFASYPKIKIVVTEATNLVHKCIVKYQCFGLNENVELPINCIGFFEVRNNLITVIDLYAKTKNIEGYIIK